MFCKKCGNQIPDDASFCTYCGTRVDIINSPLKNETDEMASNSDMPQKENDRDKENSYTDSGSNKQIKKRNTIVFASIAATAILILSVAIVNGLGKQISDNRNEIAVKDASDEPVGYNPDLFENSNNYSALLGKTEYSILSEYPNCVSSKIEPGDTLWDVIVAKEGQNFLFVKESGSSYTQVFIVDENNMVVGYDFVTEMQPIDAFIKNADTSPRIVEDKSGGNTSSYILCWKLKYGYRFISAIDINGVYYSSGFQDLVDPTQHTKFANVIYSPIEIPIMDEPGIGSGLLTSMRGNYICSDDRIRVQLETQDGFYRSIINASDGDKDYFYVDVVEEVENLNDEGIRYLFKAKCGETKLGYLYDCTTDSLYFNVVDNWDYNENYYANSKYVFTSEGILPYIERKIEGTYSSDSEGVSIDINSFGIQRTVGNQVYLDEYCGYEKVGDQTFFIKVKCNNQEFSYLFTDILNESESRGEKSLYFSDVNGWNYNDNFIANAKYHFSAGYEYVDASKNNNVGNNGSTQENKGTEEQHTDAKANEGGSTTNWFDYLYDGAYEGPFVESVFNVVKGTYYAAPNGITIDVVSEEEMQYTDGDYKVTLYVYGYETDGELLYVYVASEDGEEYQNIFTFFFSDEALNIALGSGTWADNESHTTAVAVKQ